MLPPAPSISNLSKSSDASVSCILSLGFVPVDVIFPVAVTLPKVTSSVVPTL